jgi:biotin carboxyl carrier protein
MKQEFRLTLDGVEYPVVAEDNVVTVNGRPFTVEVTDEGEILVDGIAYDIALDGEIATVGEDVYPVEIAGLTMSAAAPSGVPFSSAVPVVEAGVGSVLAIMPGKIIRVMVEVGQQVEEGEPVCVLEAMKMENELNARQDGLVRAVHVKPGDDVEKDQILVEIE